MKTHITQHAGRQPDRGFIEDPPSLVAVEVTGRRFAYNLRISCLFITVVGDRNVDSEGSIILLIGRVVEHGDDQAAQEIVDRYFDPLMRVKLGGAPRGVEDEEDVVISRAR